MKSPKLDALTGADICRIKVPQDRSYGEVFLFTTDRELFTAEFRNEDKSPIEFVIGDLNLQMISGTKTGDFTFGELEYCSDDVDGWVHLEGDAGQFSFRCDTVVVTQNPGANKPARSTRYPHGVD